MKGSHAGFAADSGGEVMALLPTPGNVDLLVASELLEAGRAAQNGMITPDRTTVIASTHRMFAIAEKSAMGTVASTTSGCGARCASCRAGTC